MAWNRMYVTLPWVGSLKSKSKDNGENKESCLPSTYLVQPVFCLSAVSEFQFIFFGEKVITILSVVFLSPEVIYCL